MPTKDLFMLSTWPRTWMVERIHLVLRGLDGDLVVHAVFEVQPEIRRGLPAGAERDEHGAGHVALRKTDLLRARAIDIHAQVRSVDELVQVHIRGARNLR